jgi:DNA-binding SARP family transcriptional activator
MVVAPAGAGKTTVMAQWASRAPADVAWYRADAADTTAGAVIVQLGAALAMVSPGHPPARDLQTLVAAIERHESPLVLVVDDLHLVEHTHVGHLLQRLLLMAPPHLRLLVGSRRTPGFNLARTEVPALVVTEEDLRFRVAETAALFRDVYGRPLAAAEAVHLTRQTEGWAAGLHLFHLSTWTRGFRDRRLTGFDTEVRYAREYLDTQILGALPDRLVTFLRRTSCFERLTAERCDDLLDVRNSRRLLVELEQRGAMIRAEAGETTYRVHGVLRRHLETELLDELDHSAAEAWFRRAATLLRIDQEYAAAVRVLVRVGDWEAAHELLGRHGAVIVSAPVPWVDAAPFWVVAADPWMQLARARRHLDNGELAAGSADAALAEAAFTDPEARRLAGRMRELASSWLPGGEPRRLDDWPDRLRLAVAGDPLASAPRLSSTSTATDELCRALSHALAGDLRTARRALRRSSGGAAAERPTIVRRLAEALLIESPATSVDGLLVDDSLPDHPWLSRIAEGVAAAQHAVAHPELLDRSLLRDEIEECDLSDDFWGALLLSAIRAVALMRGGRSDERSFEDLVGRCHRLGSTTLEAWARAGLALVVAHDGTPDAAQETGSAQAFARKAGVPGASAITYAALATLEPTRGTELLALAETTASDIGMTVRPWTWLTGNAARPEAGGFPAPRRPMASVVHEPPLVSVRCFGRFELRLSGEVPDLGRVRPRARAVLRLLALECGRPVHRELLVDALWRDLDPVAATHNLHVSVSSLRSALEPGVPRGASRIVVRDGERYQLSMPAGSFSDILQFDLAVAEAEQARVNGESTRAVTALSRAMDLYAGEVLPEDGPAEWVIGVREHYRVRVAEAAATLAELHLARHDPAAAAAAALRSLDVDPCRDASWRLLLAAYAASGDLAAAEQARRSYAEVLTSLGVVSTSAAAVLPRTRQVD